MYSSFIQINQMIYDIKLKDERKVLHDSYINNGGKSTCYAGDKRLSQV